MNKYKLLTPGPLTTTDTVKRQMLIDRCTWDNDYKKITEDIRSKLLDLAEASSDLYTSVLMQGSGSFGVESVINTEVGRDDKALIITNGAYGERIVSMAKYIGISYVVYSTECDKLPDLSEIKNILKEDKKITHIIIVHLETTTGILNPIEKVAKLSKEYDKTLIVDAMSSFGGIPIKMQDLEIDYLVSSSNKCIQGVPGFSFVIANIKKLSKCNDNSKSLCLDLYQQWQVMEKDSGKWRFTSPTHVVAAFSKAIDELIKEGGIEARYKRYKENNDILIKKFKEMGIDSYIDKEVQSPVITTFLMPNKDFDFKDFYEYIKERGFVIYPGKLTEVDTFRVGNIGEIYKEDIENLCGIVKTYIKENSMKEKILKNNIEGVIFDWAGTTVDFGCFAPVNVFIDIFKEKGISVTIKEAREPMGMLKRDHIKAMLEMDSIRKQWKGKFNRDFKEKDIDELYSNFKPKLIESLSDYVTPIPEVVDTVNELRKRNLKIGSTTGYTDDMIEIVLKGAKEKGYEPDFYVTPDSTESYGRPYPYMIYKNMEALKFSTPSKVIKVGDTKSDIKEGVSSGVWSVGVVIGSSEMGLSLEEFNRLSENQKSKVINETREAFLDAGADFTIKSMKELPDLIDHINKLISEDIKPGCKAELYGE